ncbi:hypothetical protein D9M68_937550 [compost metagenome]
MQGHETTLVALGVPDIEHAHHQIHIGSGQRESFGDTQSGGRQHAKNSAAGGRVQAFRVS